MCKHFHAATGNWNFQRPTAIVHSLAYAVAFIGVIGSSAHACNGAHEIMAAIAKGDSIAALKLADKCVAEDRAAAPSPPANFSNLSALTVVNVHFWELGRAILNAKLGRMDEAQAALRNADHWLDEYGLGTPNALMPFVPLADATRGYLAERRGETALAIQQYDSANAVYPDAAPSRLALIALESGDDKSAEMQAEAIVKKDPEDPTALFVLGRLAERRHAREAAAKFYELALRGVASATAGNPSFPLRFIEQDRIANALAGVRPQ